MTDLEYITIKEARQLIKERKAEYLKFGDKKNFILSTNGRLYYLNKDTYEYIAKREDYITNGYG